MPHNLYGGVSMENYLNEFINKLKEEGKSENAIKSYKAHMQEYLQWFNASYGETEFKGLYRVNVQEYKNYLKNIKQIGKDNHNLNGKAINVKLSALAKYNELQTLQHLLKLVMLVTM